MQNASDVLWESFYTSKPLTFWEFIQTFKNLKSLFGCVENALKRFDARSKNFQNYPDEIFVQGPVGIGKGLYCYLILLYRIYLFSLLKNPWGFFNFAPSATFGVVLLGSHSKDHKKGLMHLIKDAQSTIFNVMDSNNEKNDYHTSTGFICMKEFLDGEVRFCAQNGNTLNLYYSKNVNDWTALIGTNPVIVYIDTMELPKAWELYNEALTRIRSRFWHFNQIFFTTILVDKYPNNLYEDILDQHIQQVENDPNSLVERFVPSWLKYCKNPEDFEEVEKTYDYFINTENGKVYPIGKDTDIKSIKDDKRLVMFPSTWNTYAGSINLLDMANSDPDIFIRDWIGWPLSMPLKMELKVTDSISALTALRQLIKNYHIQIISGEEGMYASVPEVNTKIKI